MLIKMKTPLEVVGPHHALVFAAMPELYPIIGRFATKENERENFAVAWRLMVQKMNTVGERLAYSEWTTACDATLNTPELVDQGRICMFVAVKVAKTVEFYAGRFTFARLDVGVVEIEYEPHRLMDVMV